MSDWLNDREQRAWRVFIGLTALVKTETDADFMAHGLSQPDYALLVPLSEAPGGRLRAAELRRAVHWEKGRLSRHLARMAKRGLIQMGTYASSTGPGQMITLTDEGRTAIEHAAPSHVALIRRLIIDKLSSEDLDALLAIGEKTLPAGE